MKTEPAHADVLRGKDGDFDFDPANLPIEMAQDIWECFGPCSSVQECSTAADIVKQVAEDYAEENSEQYKAFWGSDGSWSLQEWLEIQLTVEQVFWEREGIYDSKIPAEARKSLIAMGYLSK